jgi:hypothetical protein
MLGGWEYPGVPFPNKRSPAAVRGWVRTRGFTFICGDRRRDFGLIVRACASMHGKSCGDFSPGHLRCDPAGDRQPLCCGDLGGDRAIAYRASRLRCASACGGQDGSDPQSSPRQRLDRFAQRFSHGNSLRHVTPPHRIPRSVRRRLQKTVLQTPLDASRH